MTEALAAAPPQTGSAPLVHGSVVRVNVSAGGVPKLPVPEAWVDTQGLERDQHRQSTAHGGPYRAVCLYSLEAIERLRAEGHPIRPGGVGENLTTTGIEWSRQPAGTRALVGETLILELTGPATPCRTTQANFLGGRFGRMSIKTHPDDSRMYARVIMPGVVRPGDAIRLQAPEATSLGARAPLLDRLDAVDQESDLRLWRAAQAGGHRLFLVEDGDLTICAAPDLPGPMFNQAGGLRRLPHMLPRVLEHFQRHGVTGWLPMHQRPFPDARPDYRLAVLSAPVEVIGATPAPPGVEVGHLPPHDWADWVAVVSGSGATGIPSGVSRALGPHLVGMRDVHVVAARAAGTVVGVGTLHIHGRVGLLRSGVVSPDWRGQGIQRALIAARARLAARSGCDLIASLAAPGTASELNLTRMGLERQIVRDVYRHDP